MANPNIVGVTTITGVTDSFTLADTNAVTILNNAAGRNKVFKVNLITGQMIWNADLPNSSTITSLIVPN